MNWLPRDGMMRPVSCLSNTPPVKVHELIDPVLKDMGFRSAQSAFSANGLGTDSEHTLNNPEAK